MSWDDAIDRANAKTDAQTRRHAEIDEWAKGASDARHVVAEFLELMRQAGNPRLRTFKQSREKPGKRWTEFLPWRRVQGWQQGSQVITPDGKIYYKSPDRDEISSYAREPDKAWVHSESLDGKPHSPFTAQEIREVLAPVLIDAGAAR